MLEEIKEFKGDYTKHTLEAEIFPDRNFIFDLTFNYENYCQVISAEEYDEKQKISVS